MPPVVIVISARVHPGEPNSSWMMKGMIDYLTGPSSGANVLRKNFLFKIVPMLNPDGVINGNTRVNLAGWDLNRKWSYPVEKLFPTVYHLKRQIANLQTRDRVAIYCDLHGHSLNRNIFTYGCYTKKASSKKLTTSALLSASMGGSTVNLNCGSSSTAFSSSSITASIRARMKNDPRVFPMVVAKNSHFFSFASCDFKVHKSKLNTARVVVNHELGVINSYTLEASFCGPDFGPRKDTQFSTWDLEEMGKSWCQSLLIYFDLVDEVKAADAQRDELLKSSSKLAASIEVTSDLLSDCQAAISELFANAEIEIDDEMDDLVSMDSDLSGAEDEPIPPNLNGDAFMQVGASTGGEVNGYSSVPEDGVYGAKCASETTPRGPRRKESRASRKLSTKGSKRSKSKHKRDKGKGKERPQEEDNAASSDMQTTHTAEMHEATVKKKASSSSTKPRRKPPKSSKKEQLKSFRATKKSTVSDTEAIVENVLALPLMSARVAEVVVLPIMPDSAGRRSLKTGQTSVGHGQQQQEAAAEGGHRKASELAADDRGFLCPTPPAQKGRSKSIRLTSPSPVELPLVKPLPMTLGGADRGGSYKEKLLEACGLSGKSGSGGGGAHSDSDEYDDDDSDASVQSGPESYLSEF